MKKIISVLTAGVLFSALSLTAFASTLDENSQSGNTAVEYQTQAAYTVEIPEKVVLQKDSDVNADVKIYGSNINDPVMIASGKKVQVKIDASSEFSVTYGGDTLDYTVKIGDTELSAGSVVAEAVSNTTQSETLTFSQPSAAQYAGTYTGTVTFNVSLENIS